MARRGERGQRSVIRGNSPLPLNSNGEEKHREKIQGVEHKREESSGEIKDKRRENSSILPEIVSSESAIHRKG